MASAKSTRNPLKGPPSTPVFPVLRGEVTKTLVEEIVDMCRELDQRRSLGDDLAVWFEENPQLSELFGAFQIRRQQERAAAAKGAHGAASAKRRAR